MAETNAGSNGDGVALQISMVGDGAPGIDPAAQIPADKFVPVPLDSVDPAAWQLPDDDDAPDYTRIASLRAGDTAPTFTNASDGGNSTSWPGYGGVFDGGFGDSGGAGGGDGGGGGE